MAIQLIERPSIITVIRLRRTNIRSSKKLKNQYKQHELYKSKLYDTDIARTLHGVCIGLLWTTQYYIQFERGD